MKNLKTTFLALALVAGVSGAFVTQAANTANVQAPTYNWNGSGPNGSGPLNGKTVAQAKTFYGCPGSNAFCARGTDPNGILPDQIIRKL
jgi:hypothetical protein